MKRAKDNKASASTPEENEEKTYVVRVARDLSEYADVAVSTTDSSAAEEIVSDLLEGDKLDNLNYESGDDREGPYTCDSWEKEEDEQARRDDEGEYRHHGARQKNNGKPNQGKEADFPQQAKNMTRHWRMLRISLNHHAGWLAPLKNLPHYKLFALDSQLFAPLPWSALRHLARDGFSCAPRKSRVRIGA